MVLLLKTVLVFALLLLVLYGVLVYVMHRVKTAVGKATGGGGTPRRIHVRRDDAAALADPSAMDALATPLLAQGFEDGGIWVIQELHLAMRVVAKPEAHLYGVVYDRHPKAGVWIDLVTLYEDGTTVTCSNLAQPSSLDEMPGHGKIPAPGADALTTYRTMLEKRPKKPMTAVRASEVPARFEEAYAREMDWRDSRGGPTADEIRRIAAASGRTVTDEQVRMTRELMAGEARRKKG
jgi:hypothetical protein